MNLQTKIEILSAAAKYDSSCSSSGSDRALQNSGLGNCSLGGLCHSFSSDGRCISLLKLLLTNHCIYDCAYCQNRASNDIKRAYMSPQEVARVVIEFYNRNYIEGVFLSSGIVRNPDYTMELLNECARTLRNKHGFSGYIHIKIIPDASSELILEAAKLSDRISSNIELPSEKSLKLLAPQKSKNSLFLPFKIGRENRVSMSTQMIIGATPESDLEIISLAESLYQKNFLKRVYYSAYIPVNSDPKLPAPLEYKPPLLREHRLYQADWLIRFYGFKASDILNQNYQFLDEGVDPKTAWAIRNIHLFPVDINRASFYELIRVPGIGLRGAKKIIEARRYKKLGLDELKTLKIQTKKSRYFINAKNHKPYDLSREKLYEISSLSETKSGALNLFSLSGEAI